MLSGLIWLTVVAFCWAERNDAGFEYEANQEVNSIGYTVLYGDESISVINQAVTDIEKQSALKAKVRLNDGIKPLPATDVKCFMSVDRYCSKEMAHMKGVLIEAIRDDCVKCETEDKNKAGRIIAALMAHDPIAWKTFLTRSILQTKEPKKYAAPKEVKLDIIGEPEEIEQTANKFIKPGFRVRVRRYMPEPNLPPLRVNLKTKEDSQDVISVPMVQDTIPELPEETRIKLMGNFNLRPEHAIQLVNEPILLNYFLEVTSKERNPTKVANLLLNELLTVLNKRKLDVEDCPITIDQMKETVDLLLDHKISLDICKKLLDELVRISDSNTSPGKIVEEKNWLLISNVEDIKKSCMDVLDSNPKLVKQYGEGKTKVFKALLGIVIKNSRNKIDMSVASKVMEELLKKL